MNFAPPPDRQQYYAQIWAHAREIPHGQVATYGQLSKLVPQPDGVSDEDYRASASRWAGQAMADCPDDVPWHRVVNSQGKFHHLSANEQRRRLEAEGIVLTNGKLNLTKHQWRGPGGQNEPTQGSLFASIDEDVWSASAAGFGDEDLAAQ